MERFVDRPGYDYASFEVDDTVTCLTACAKDGRCRAFTFVGPGVQGSNAICYLKTDVAAPVAVNAYMKSSVKRGLEVNTDRYGADYRSFVPTEAAPQICQAACAAEDACQSWTFAPTGTFETVPRCYLKSGIPAASRNEGLVSGIKGTEFF